MKYTKRIILCVLVVLIPFLLYFIYWKLDVKSVKVVFSCNGFGHIMPSKAYWEEGNPDIGGLAGLGGFLSKVPKPYLLLDGGNLFQGTPEGVLTKGRMIIDIMNQLGYDAAGLGNHEFDLGQGVLREMAKAAEFDLLGSNIREKDTGGVPGYLKPYKIINQNGIKIGVIGTVSEELKEQTLEDNIKGLDITNSLEAINKVLEDLAAEKTQINILLSNVNIETNKKIASEIKGVDLIIGGARENTEVVRVGRTLICNVGQNHQNIGSVKLSYSSLLKRILSYDYDLVPLYIKKYPLDDSVKKAVEENSEEVSVEMEKVIGNSKVRLTNHLSGKAKKHGELALGNWQADLMKDITESDFAFQNTSMIRGTINKGEVRIRDLWELSPFGNTIVKMTLTGEQIYRLLEESAAKKYSKLQVSGLKVVYNSSLPEGKRILNVIQLDEEGNKEEIDKEKEYDVVTNSYLAVGGDGYAVFKEAEDITNTAIILRELQIDYIKENSPIFAEVEGRLINVSIEEN
jgi:2',3'-cyclic-nucleotide 2'-phosphodiesterase/3'-nucleotidase